MHQHLIHQKKRRRRRRRRDDMAIHMRQTDTASVWAIENDLLQHRL
jgi:hypothetical protein